VDVEALTTSPVKFSGKVTAGVGAGAGLEYWPGKASWNEITEELRFSGFFTNVATFKVDARPKPHLRFHLSLRTSLDDEEMKYEDIFLHEVFTDYTLAETIFFRAGMQSLTWGQGRLLDNPANIVSDVGDGLGLKISMPAGPGTVNGVVYSKKAWVQEHVQPYDPKAFAYAGQWESTIGPLTFNLAGRYRKTAGGPANVDNSLGLSFGLGPVDVAADFVGRWDTQGFPSGFPGSQSHWDAVGRLFWESENGNWTLGGEYQFDSQVAAAQGHQGALAVKMPSLASGGWRPGISWKHAFQDHSGEVVAGIKGDIAPDLDLQIGIPVVYGTAGSVYREKLSEDAAKTAYEEDEADYSIPVENVVSLLLSVHLSVSF
jgi:hypothetical protein